MSGFSQNPAIKNFTLVAKPKRGTRNTMKKFFTLALAIGLSLTGLTFADTMNAAADANAMDASDGYYRQGNFKFGALSDVPMSPGPRSMLTLYDDGYILSGENQVRIGGFGRATFQWFSGSCPNATTFDICDACLDIRVLYNEDFAFRMAFDFAKDEDYDVKELYMEYRRWPGFRVRFGQFRVPFGLGNLYTKKYSKFQNWSIGCQNIPAGFTTVTNMDQGLMFLGLLWDEKVEYAASITNGSVLDDDDTRNGDINNTKDLTARVTWQPWRDSSENWVNQLYFGGSTAQSGSQNRSSDRGIYIEDDVRVIFCNNVRQNFAEFDGTLMDGGHPRYAAELEWYKGSWHFASEWKYGQRRCVDGDNYAFQSFEAQMAWIMTGERQNRNGPVIPKRDLNPRKGHWGAWELAGRWERFWVDESHNNLEGSLHVSGFTTALNWWLNRFWRISCEGTFYWFSDGLRNLGLSSEKNIETIELFTVASQFVF